MKVEIHVTRQDAPMGPAGTGYYVSAHDAETDEHLHSSEDCFSLETALVETARGIARATNAALSEGDAP